MGIINSNKTDPNKILPMKYPWAREHYKNAIANTDRKSTRLNSSHYS